MILLRRSVLFPSPATMAIPLWEFADEKERHHLEPPWFLLRDPAAGLRAVQMIFEGLSTRLIPGFRNGQTGRARAPSPAGTGASSDARPSVGSTRAKPGPSARPGPEVS